MQRNNNSKQRFAQPFPASQKYVIFVNNGKWNPSGGRHVVKWAKKKKTKKRNVDLLCPGERSEIKFYLLLWLLLREDVSQPVGNVLKPNTSKSSLPVKAFCHLRGGGGGRGEVSSSMGKYSEVQEKLKYRSLLLLLVEVYFTFEHAQIFKPSKKYITVVTLWRSDYCILSLHTTSCKQYEKRKNQKAVNLLWSQKFSLIKEEKHHR